MPWTGPQFASRHNHALTPAQAQHAALMANAMLRRGVPEGIAIATANKHFQHRDVGGGVDSTQAGVGGMTPSSQAMNPMVQGLVQQYASLPTEKLQELAARAGGSPQGQIIRSVLQRKLTQPNAQQQTQPPQAPQPLAGASPINPGAGLGPPAMWRGGPMPHRAAGGMMGMPAIQPVSGAAAPVPSTPISAAGGSGGPANGRTPGYGPPGPSGAVSPGMVGGIIGGIGGMMMGGPAGAVGGFNLGRMLGNSMGSGGGGGQAQSAGGVGAAGQGTAVGSQGGFGTPSGMGGMRRGGAMAHRAPGGDMGISIGQASPWWTRSEARGADSSGGFLAGTTGGRADAVKTTAPGGSYVLPADVVAGLGDGNNLAGARVWDEILRSGPMGTPQERGARGMGPPRAPAPFRGQTYRAGGTEGHAGKPQPVALSHGEIVVSPADVLRIGKGDFKTGWRELDRFVMEQRARYAHKLRHLPPPVGAKKNAA